MSTHSIAGLKTEFKSATVNVTSVFESLKFYCVVDEIYGRIVQSCSDLVVLSFCCLPILQTHFPRDKP